MAEHEQQTDWEAIERSPEFRELVSRKKAFIIPATIFFMSWYFGFIVLTGYAPDFMGREFITDGLTVGYTLALSQFVMSFVLGLWYVRRANRVFDPLAASAREAAEAAGSTTTATDGDRPEASTRFRRGEVAAEQEVPQR